MVTPTLFTLMWGFKLQSSQPELWPTEPSPWSHQYTNDQSMSSGAIGTNGDFNAAEFRKCSPGAKGGRNKSFKNQRKRQRKQAIICSSGREAVGLQATSHPPTQMLQIGGAGAGASLPFQVRPQGPVQAAPPGPPTPVCWVPACREGFQGTHP